MPKSPEYDQGENIKERARGRILMLASVPLFVIAYTIHHYTPELMAGYAVFALVSFTSLSLGFCEYTGIVSAIEKVVKLDKD